ncbi:rRNA adenine N-6-methyltransferase family protein [Nocardiopsis alba]|uniref:rRNA adenine N-6-methyltransferase family protein n=1 Tax=Nocardiopsis alba TaxID=53437 RepID=UPI0033AF9BEA
MSDATTRPNPTDLARELAARLPGPEHVRAPFATVPRHRFLPDVLWDENSVRHDRSADPDAWTRTAYTDQALVTQRDDGREDGTGLPTSSSSAPTVMARMLTAARIEPRDRVLEIGTGTGYNAALLSTLVGDDRVTSIEIDPRIAARARRSLIEAEFTPTVLTGDGENFATGLPGPAYDQAIATCTVGRVPAVWIRQVREHGRIVTPWAPTPGAPGGVLAVLDVADGRAEGRFEGGLAFMWARGQRRAGHRSPVGAEADTVTRVDGDPREPWLDGEQALLLSLLMPGWAHGMGQEDDAEEPYVWIASTTCPSWARLHADGRIERSGEWNLVDQVAQVREWWHDQGEPGYTDFGLTVDLARERQTLWLHEPHQTLWSTRRDAPHG